MPKKTNNEREFEPFRFTVSDQTEDGVILEVTKEEYQAGLDKGWTDDDMLPPGKHVFRRVSPDRVAKPEDFLPKNITVNCELRLKLDVLNYLKRLAGSEDLKEVERVLDEKLRPLMESEESANETPVGSQIEKAA